jgi:hypothetical protein
MPKITLKYQPKGKRNLGRPLKYGRIQFCSAVTYVNRPNTGKEDDDDDDLYIILRKHRRVFRV